MADQSFTGPNLSLATNVESGYPVRLVRATTEGFRFDGLYLVEDAWQGPGQSGFTICRFRLSRLDPQTVPVGRTIEATPRRLVSHYRLVRDTAVAARVKALYKHLCQICCQEVHTVTGRYAEGAHVVPLGRGFDGPDVIENILCLCPNDHARFDHGGIFISDAMEVFDSSGELLGSLRLHPAHRIRSEFVAAHRRMFGHPDT